jgi:uncharacterized protein with von Willebrand factor type A (vWA) domain
MIKRIIRFAAACRAAGLRVSTSELIDAAGHLQHVDLAGEKDFKTALRANFAKSRREQRAFDRVYELFFHGPLKTNAAESETADPGEIKDLLDEAGLGENLLDLALFDFVKGGRPAACAQAQRQGRAAVCSIPAGRP